MRAALYFEAHVNIDPVFDESRAEVAAIAAAQKFRLAQLIMRKKSADAEQQHRDDTFMTAHGMELRDISDRTTQLVRDLQAKGYRVRRYKIEDTILDSRKADVFCLLNQEAT